MYRVLIVDDAAFMRMNIRMKLEKNGFAIVGEADNGLEAIEQYQKLQPDLVTMDITMDKMTGIEALKEIIKLDPNASIVMLSAMGQERMVRDAIMNGAKSFIIKPFTEKHIVKALNQIVNKEHDYEVKP